MTSKRIERIEKVYFLSFLVSFGIWVIVLCLTCFPFSPVAVNFPNTPMLILLLVSGVIATISGADYLRIHFRSDYTSSVQTPLNQSLVFQDSLSQIEKPQQSAIVESEESKQGVFELTAYEANERRMGHISFEIDRWKRIHYRDMDSGRFIKKNLANPLANIRDIENFDYLSHHPHSIRCETTRKPTNLINVAKPPKRNKKNKTLEKPIINYY